MIATTVTADIYVNIVCGEMSQRIPAISPAAMLTSPVAK